MDSERRAHGRRNVTLRHKVAWRMTLASGLIAFVLVWAIPAEASARQKASASARQLPAIPRLVFDGATVVDVEQGKLIANQRVVITGNRVESVGDTGAVVMPTGARVVDARGKYLIPGLWDMHVHTGNGLSIFYPLLVANGVTGVRDMWHLPFDSLLQWRREIASAKRVGPRIVGTGRFLAGPDPYVSPSPFPNISFLVTIPEEGRSAVDSLKAMGVDFVKIRDFLPPEVYFAVLDEARRVGLAVDGHVSAAVPVAEAADSGQRSIEHLVAVHQACSNSGIVTSYRFYVANAPPISDDDQIDASACTAIAAHLAQNGTWLTPTLDAEYHAFTPEPERLQYMPGATSDCECRPSHVARDRGLYDLYVQTLQIMFRAGVRVLAGTDAAIASKVDNYPLRGPVPGFSLHDELLRLVDAGMTPLAALQAATLNPAKMLRATDSLGIVAQGKLADLVLLNADPLASITNTRKIHAVVANGRYFDRTALDSLLAEVRAKVRDSKEP